MKQTGKTAEHPATSQPTAIEHAVAALRDRFGERVSTGEALRRQHANTLTWIANEPPDAVVWPLTTEEVVEIVRVAGTHRVPLIPFGAGTSLEGHVNAPRGGISVDMSRMDRVLEVNARDLDCTVEAGVSQRSLNEHLRDVGLFFPVDPGAGEATLGGMASTRASGTNAVRYGTMRENVLSLTAVMADGSVVRTGGRARKSAAGYDLTRLLVGAEGTLGIITELSLRLYGIPEAVAVAVCAFDEIGGACNAAIDAIQSGLAVARIELLDAVQIRAVNIHAGLRLREEPTLFVELHGPPAATREAVALFEEVARDNGALAFEWAEREEDRRRLWKARHDAYWAIKGAFPGKAILATDVCVPISRLADCVGETVVDAAAHGLIAPVVGHIGDGNFHTTPVVDPADADEMRRLEGFLDRLAARAIAMEGTCTGEHGVGQGKRKHLNRELGSALDVMRAIKAALDPLGIMNPGKILE